MTRSRTAEVGAAAAGAIAAIVVAGMLVPVRDTFGNTNMALVLVVVIVAAAALGGRFVGAVTSVAAALAFNFFHTQPYRTLSVDNREDITTVVLLLVVGLIVGELANLHSRQRGDAQTRAAGAHWLEQVAGQVAGGRPIEEVWPIVQQGLIDELGLVACQFEPAPYHGQLPAVQRSGRLEGPLTWAREGFELPRRRRPAPGRAPQPPVRPGRPAADGRPRGVARGTTRRRGPHRPAGRRHGHGRQADATARLTPSPNCRV